MELFLKEKSDLAQSMLSLIKELKAKYDIQVKIIRGDNSGKNIKFEKSILEKYSIP